ncbi:xylulokinase [Gilvimarinus xylanilyticus]|uniref:FGGY family carbohydrate kinase n=1 Tax=Gilvimarinus xylanilyticus TaxID=2944139 RepID=A0A9X2I745_9GAMM|nr:FGGY family carbohydrate kinase [Gilvimarinus xylanilyticus]MCP8900077.1 FGGY family carbohydrate kinase [Gilvimarinus xylanilyticus]
MYFLGLDIGSSSVKLSVIDGDSGKRVANATYPPQEMTINAPESGWAEQAPEDWWDAVKKGCEQLWQIKPEARDNIDAIGISYQMHGLVAVDKDGKVLRPSIIWCDSRAVATGEQAFSELGKDWCMEHLLNAPGNFTAAKLRWVQENEPELYSRIHKILLPGDYIALKLTGECTTTASGLSEGVFWDFSENQVADKLLKHWHIDPVLLPRQVLNLGVQGEVNEIAARELGINAGAKLAFRAGDQVANAMSLNVLEPGDVATTAGTSGVVYAVTDKNIADPDQRINTFLHVNKGDAEAHRGLLACINGAGRMNSWLRGVLSTGGDLSYPTLNELGESVDPGSDGLNVFPFGNGAERIMRNKLLSAQLDGLDLNRHGVNHIARATQEGVAYAMNLGFDLIKDLGAETRIVRAGHSNMFLSPVFTSAFVNLIGAPLELYQTDSADGVARAAAWGCDFYTSRDDVFRTLTCKAVLEPQAQLQNQYQDLYGQWRTAVEQRLIQNH